MGCVLQAGYVGKLDEDLMSVHCLAELRQVDKSRDKVMKQEERQMVLFIFYHSEKEASKLIVV